jgi:hypothetical protein
MLLLLLEMQANHALKLPYRAAEQQPESVRLRLTAGRSFPLLEQKKEADDTPESAAIRGLYPPGQRGDHRDRADGSDDHRFSQAENRWAGTD